MIAMSATEVSFSSGRNVFYDQYSAIYGSYMLKIVKSSRVFL